jgi:hypothetical protein
VSQFQERLPKGINIFKLLIKKLKMTHHKKLLISSLLLTVLTMPFCFAPKKAIMQDDMAAPTVFYETDIKPIMLRSCTPCHFPTEGKKKMLDSYLATKENIVDIINRVQLPPEEKKFMPFKSKKTPLSAAEIDLLKTWYNEGMPEKPAGADTK